MISTVVLATLDFRTQEPSSRPSLYFAARVGKWGSCLCPALLDRLRSGRGCRCSRGQCDAPVGVLAYGAVCAPRVDVGALLAGTPQGGMCCLRRHRRRRRLVSRSTGGRRRKAANKISSPTTTAGGWLLRKCQRRKEHHDSRSGPQFRGHSKMATDSAARGAVELRPHGLIQCLSRPKLVGYATICRNKPLR